MGGLVKKSLFLGDLLQLPPVFESPIYMPLSLDTLQKHTGCLGNGKTSLVMMNYSSI